MSIRSRIGCCMTVTAIACLALTAAAAEDDFPTLNKRLQAEKPKFA
ncbi:MAG: hypothetical protein Q7T21_05765 [Gallionella sp.]|nr:hypothetical protein [Gallionella sp.]